MPLNELDYHAVLTIKSKKPRPDGKLKDKLYEWEGVPGNLMLEIYLTSHRCKAM